MKLIENDFCELKSILTKELLLAENEQHQNEDLKKSLIEEKKKNQLMIIEEKSWFKKIWAKFKAMFTVGQ